MCDERERLIDYLYDACEADERRRVETPSRRPVRACREEISALRAVRLDLLAWDVPEHGSVWKPFAPARTDAVVARSPGLGAGGGRQRDVPARHRRRARRPAIRSGPGGGDTDADVTHSHRAAGAGADGCRHDVAGTADRDDGPGSARGARAAGRGAHGPGGVVRGTDAVRSSRCSARRIRQGSTGASPSPSIRSARFVHQSTYNAYLKNDLPYLIRQEISAALAMQQQQGGNK